MRYVVSSLACLAANTLGAQSTVGASAAAKPAVVQHAVCFRGRPLRECRRFWITELELTGRIVSNPWPIESPRQRIPHQIGGFFSTDLGMMWNRDSVHATGGTLHLGASNGIARVAAKARRRVWEGNTALDLEAGALQLSTNNIVPFASRSDYGVTLGGAVGAGDYAGLTGHVEAVYARQPQFAIMAGGRLGSKSSAIATGTFVGLLLLLSALAGTGRIHMD